MFGLTALELARIQFGFTISFHIIFPAITIGLASYLAVLEGLWLWKKDVAYRDLYHFWSKIFAVNFAMGVVSGLVMAYQFGTNWSYFSAFAGSITGPLLTYEVLPPLRLARLDLGGQRCSARHRGGPVPDGNEPGGADRMNNKEFAGFPDVALVGRADRPR
jgi:hypothetical protein